MESHRRTVLKGVLLGLVALGGRRAARALPAAAAQEGDGTEDPRRARPRPGDTFVHAFGPREGEAVEAAHLVVSSEQVTAWARDPASGAVRDGSRLNQVLLLRFAPEELSEETRAVSAAGVVAYSAICPHTGCDVSFWAEESGNLLCSCHESEFDPRNAAEVVGGPAPRRLPYLPLKIENGVLMAAGGFSARIRFQKDL